VRVAEQITPEEARKLASLGYLGAAAPAGGGLLPDPRDHIGAFREVRDAWAAFEQKRYADAIQSSRELLERYPRMVDLWQLQADALGELGRVAEGAEAAKKGLAVDPASGQLCIRVADLSARAGRIADAQQYAELAVRTMPAEAHAILARVALAQGALENAALEAKLAIEADPNRPLPYALLGQIALARNDAAGALEALDQAIQVSSRSGRPVPNLNSTRGVVLIRLGRESEAEGAFREEIRLFPGVPEAWRNLIVFCLEHDRATEAEGLIRSLISDTPVPASYAVAAEALASTGRRESSREIAREGVRRYPGHPLLTRLAK
jgi:tetratricopeptide (TPR) repeat protein